MIDAQHLFKHMFERYDQHLLKLDPEKTSTRYNDRCPAKAPTMIAGSKGHGHWDWLCRSGFDPPGDAAIS